MNIHVRLAFLVSICTILTAGAENWGQEKPPGQGTKKEGQWNVTPVGKSRSIFMRRYFEDANRLLVAIDSEPPQLWDTKNGVRVAILADQKNGMDSCAISP